MTTFPKKVLPIKEPRHENEKEDVNEDEDVIENLSEHGKEDAPETGSSRRHVLIVGAGAAGLTAAIFAAGASARVTLLERTDKAGKKILMSGGTRCNVLPVTMELSDYFTGSSPNLMKRIFRSWSLGACQRWFTEDLGLKLACETSSNKWFPESNSAMEVRDVLLNKALESGVNVVYNAPVDRIEHWDGKWVVRTAPRGLREASGKGRAEAVEIQTMGYDALIIATGGLSVPSIGTDGMGHRFLAKAGHQAAPVYAALTPLTGSDAGHRELAGVSLDVQLSVYREGRKVAESNRSGFLFTHRGYSGPAVLDVSHFQVLAMEHGQPVPEYRVNWDGTGREAWEKRLLGGRGQVASVLKNHLPNRLADALSLEAGVTGRNCAELGRNDRKKLLQLLTEYPLKISGHEGYKKAEVTGGGVPLGEINTATLESSIHPQLYLCGEILDVFGRIGGFNFYWAWVTGRLAGMSAAKTGN
ncbi:MAG: aminoacetone oxidase family FAD-binding enzyme [Rhodothermaceae bacterium]|nr:aminoacetone oxidase family FAD-binding enzyme [Rhodothermaceae bacterium]